MLDSDNRPWGRWEEYINEPSGYRVKRLIINPGKRFSLQKHAHRNEHWVIVQGRGIVTINNKTWEVTAGDSLFIERGARHRLENSDEEKALIVIEIQTGTCLEDDIIRLEDDWGRS